MPLEATTPTATKVVLDMISTSKRGEPYRNAGTKAALWTRVKVLTRRVIKK